MVGGSEQAYQKCLPLFEVLGKSWAYLGPSGMGQVCKACNQIAVACNLLGVCEAMGFARKSGLDIEKMLGVLTTGGAASFQMERNGPKIISGNMDPGFKVRLMLKDLDIVSASSRHLDLPLNSVNLVANYFRSLVANGQGDCGTQALSTVLEKLGAFRFSE